MLKKVWTWSCNNKTFFDKISAVKESVREDKPIYYNAPQGYDQFTWFQEPTDSWEQVLKDRAEEIRQSSKKLNLLFSGGCDSTKMLETFIKNKIHIDEITCLKYGIPASDLEVTEVAEPYLKSIRSKIPKTKINIKNISMNDYKQFYNDPYWHEKETWANAIRFRLTHQHMENTVFHQSATDTVHLLGRDKPHIIHHKGEWYTYFLDVDIETNKFLNNSNCVFFYADNEKIHSKQCHMLKKYFEQNFQSEQYQTPELISKIDQKYINAGCGRIQSPSHFFIRKETKIEKIFDPTGKQVMIEGNKDKLAITSLFQDKQFEDLVTKWKLGLEGLESTLSKNWFKKNKSMFGTIGVFSKFYCLTNPKVSLIDELFPNGWK